MVGAPSKEKRGARKKSAAAEYIAIEASRLARMAGANNLSLLAYLIDMAVLEAWREASEGDAGAAASRSGGAETPGSPNA